VWNNDINADYMSTDYVPHFLSGIEVRGEAGNKKPTALSLTPTVLSCQIQHDGIAAGPNNTLWEYAPPFHAISCGYMACRNMPKRTTI
jgi:hypothetical protein